MCVALDSKWGSRDGCQVVHLMTHGDHENSCMRIGLDMTQNFGGLLHCGLGRLDHKGRVILSSGFCDTRFAIASKWSRVDMRLSCSALHFDGQRHSRPARICRHELRPVQHGSSMEY